MTGSSTFCLVWKILASLLFCIQFNLCFADDCVADKSQNHFCQFFQAEDGYDSRDSSSKIHFSGEGGAGFFDTGPEGQFPNGEFLVDEAKLFVEAEIRNGIYFFGEINLITREEGDDNLHLGELYIEFEGVSRFWTSEELLSIRLGRFDIPFGEEYLTRDAIDNPLITHSLMDIWGVDEGIEAYGSLKRLNYVIAVQNGGDPILHDFNPDKAVVGRVKYNWTKKVHVSFSAMRTGKLDVQQDKLSELWFGNANLRPLGSPDTTSTFQASLMEGDAFAGWKSGYCHVDGGTLHYDDDDTSADNSRDVRYFEIDAVQNINNNKEKTFYAAGQFSKIISPQGFPIVGSGNPDLFLLDKNRWAEQLWRLSLGIGYRIGRNLLLKTNYAVEHGQEVNGSKRDSENFFGAEAAFQF